MWVWAMIDGLNLMYRLVLTLCLSLLFLCGCSSKGESITAWSSESRQQLEELISIVDSQYEFDGDEKDIFLNVIETREINSLKKGSQFLSHLQLKGYDKFAVYADGSVLISGFKYLNGLRMFDGFLYSKYDVLNKKRNGFLVDHKLDNNWYYVKFSD